MGHRGAPQYLDTLFRGALLVLLALGLGMLGIVVFFRGVLPDAYPIYGNVVQLSASTVAAGAAAWAYYRRGPDLLLAHGAFASATWTLANTFWYAYYILIGEGLNYPTVADLGFAGVFLFLIAGYQEGMARGRLPWWSATPVALPLLAAGFWLVLALGADAKTLTTLVVFALAAALLTAALLRSAYRHPVLLAATVTFALTHILSSLDGTLPSPPWITHAGGALAAMAFSLFGLAYLGYTREANHGETMQAEPYPGETNEAEGYPGETGEAEA